jgi:hypothetical protein
VSCYGIGWSPTLLSIEPKHALGAKGVVDLTGIVGYYTFRSMQMNVVQFPTAKDAATLPRISDK